MTLTQFLLARIAEDEATASALNEAYNSEDSEMWAPAVLINARALLSPARVLAECEAKRRIVNSFAASSESLTARTAEMAVVRMVLKLLALPYADHPDYREEWRP